MKTKILTLLIVFILLAPTVVTAANTFTVNYNVQVTGFTLEITASGQTAMNFTGQPNSNAVKPEGTNNGVNAWGKINNTGDTTLTFNISAPTNPDITLRVSSNTGMGDTVVVTGTPASPTGWAGIVGGSSANIFAEADFAVSAVKTSTTATIGAT